MRTFDKIIHYVLSGLMVIFVGCMLFFLGMILYGIFSLTLIQLFWTVIGLGIFAWLTKLAYNFMDKKDWFW